MSDARVAGQQVYDYIFKQPSLGQKVDNWWEQNSAQWPALNNAMRWDRIPTPYELWNMPGDIYNEVAGKVKTQAIPYLTHDVLGVPQDASTAPPPPSAPPPAQADPIMQMLLGLNSPAPAQTVSVPRIATSNVRDPYEGLQTPKMEAPEAPAYDSEDRLNNILAGLAAGAMNADQTQNASILLNAGLGALGGMAKGGKEAKDAARAHKREVVDYKNRGAQNEFSNQIALRGAKGEVEKIRLAKQMQEQGLLTPKVDGGVAIIPTLKGDRIEYKIQPMTGKNAALGMAAYGASSDIPTLFETLALTSPDALDVAADKVGVSSQLLRGVGLGEKSVDLATQARIMNYIAQNAPEQYKMIQQMAMQRAIQKSVLK